MSACATAPALLAVDGLTLRIEATGAPILIDVGFSVEAGEIVGLSGGSGSGKSLLAAAIIGLLPAGVVQTGGTVRWRGRALERLPPRERELLRGRGIAMMVQDAQSSLDPLRRVGRQLDETLRLAGGLDAAAAREAATALMRSVGLPAEMLRRYPHALSGGQAQRVVLALSLAPGPALLLVDEPTSALDAANAARVVETLRATAKRGAGTGVLMASHDDAVLRHADRVMRLSGGRLEPAGAGVPRRAPSSPTPALPAERAGAAEILRFDGVRHAYRGRHDTVPALDGVSFAIAAGTTLALLGESGSGKTTAARIAAGLLRPSGGKVIRARGDADREARVTLAGMVFQDAREAFDPRWKVARSIVERLRGWPGRARQGRLETLLQAVGLPRATAMRLPRTLSGGELQRAALARALAASPSLLVCDEPTSALDGVARQEILELLRHLQDTMGFAMLLVTHDMEAARLLGHRAVLLSQGRIVAEGLPAEMQRRGDG